MFYSIKINGLASRFSLSLPPPERTRHEFIYRESKVTEQQEKLKLLATIRRKKTIASVISGMGNSPAEMIEHLNDVIPGFRAGLSATAYTAMTMAIAYRVCSKDAWLFRCLCGKFGEIHSRHRLRLRDHNAVTPLDRFASDALADGENIPFAHLDIDSKRYRVDTISMLLRGGAEDLHCADCMKGMVICAVSGMSINKTASFENPYGFKVWADLGVKGGYHSAASRRYAVRNLNTSESRKPAIDLIVGTELELYPQSDPAGFIMRAGTSGVCSPERDGSLGDSGVEIVTGYGYHTVLEEVVTEVLEGKIKGDSNLTANLSCGQHVTMTIPYGSRVVSSLVYFCYSGGGFPDLYQELMGRQMNGSYNIINSNWRNYVAAYRKQKRLERLQEITYDHRSSVHWKAPYQDGRSLVEFRDPAGTASAREAITKIQFFVALAQYCIDSSSQEPSFTGMVEWFNNNPRLFREMPHFRDTIGIVTKRLRDRPAIPINTTTRLKVTAKVAALNGVASIKAAHGGRPNPYLSAPYAIEGLTVVGTDCVPLTNPAPQAMRTATTRIPERRDAEQRS